MRRCLLVACALAFVPSVAMAADVLLKSGGRLTGRILARTDTSITVDVGPGTITVPMTSVLRVEDTHSTIDEYYERAGRLRGNDLAGWMQLGVWASNQGLGTQARSAFMAVLAIDPNHAEANRALGRVQVDGRWMTEADSYRARGYVLFDGDWMTPADRDAVLARRDAAHQAEWARLDAERRIREAEAREAAARQAELAASQYYAVGTPLWYGSWGPSYGYGPGSGHGGRWPGRLGGKGPGAGPAWPSDINRSWPTGPLGSSFQLLGPPPGQPGGSWHQAAGSTSPSRPGAGPRVRGGASPPPGPPGGSPPAAPPPSSSRPVAKPVRPR